MLAEQFERIYRVSCVTPLAQQQAEPLHSPHGAAPTAKEAPCPQHGVITSEISNPFLFVIVNLKIFCLFSLGNSPSRSLGSRVSLLTVQEHSPGDPQQAGCREGTAFTDPLSPLLWSLHPLSHAKMLSNGHGCLSLLSRHTRCLHRLGSSWGIALWGMMLRLEQASPRWDVPQACLHSSVWDLEPACYTPSHHVHHMVVTQLHIDEGAVSLRVLWCTNNWTSLHSVQHTCGADCSCLFAGSGLSYFFYSLTCISDKCIGVSRIKPTAVGIAQI